MKILIVEYITGGGVATQTLSAALAAEGDLMLQALIRDLTLLPDVQLSVFRDIRLPRPPLPSSAHPNWIDIDKGSPFWETVSQAIDTVAAVWPIAPETGGVLERLCRLVEEKGKRLLNSSADAVRLTSSKLETSRWLATQGLPVVTTHPYAALKRCPEGPVIVKPDDGVGCTDCHVIDSPEAWSRFNPGESTNRWIVQPWIEAEAQSLSALFNHGQACLLSVNRQRVTRQGGHLKLEGCEVNALPDHDRRYATLVNRIAGAIPGLQGYVGIDLLKTNDSLKLLEINPRLTTSYAGLRPSLAINPAEWVVRVMPGDAWPAIPHLSLNPIDIHWHHP